jgi:hypothetical protein
VIATPRSPATTAARPQIRSLFTTNRFSGNLGRVTLRFDKNRMLYQEVGVSGEKDMFSSVDKSAAGEQAAGAPGGASLQPVDMEKK